jgi:type IV secretion system protein TrbD
MDHFQAPIHQSLTQPILIGGLPRDFAILCGTFTMAMIIGMNSLIGLPFGMIIFGIGRVLTKHDPHFLQTFKRHLHEKPFYEA